MLSLAYASYELSVCARFLAYASYELSICARFLAYASYELRRLGPLPRNTQAMNSGVYARLLDLFILSRLHNKPA